jgi:hypothetical protein
MPPYFRGFLARITKKIPINPYVARHSLNTYTVIGSVTGGLNPKSANHHLTPFQGRAAKTKLKRQPTAQIHSTIFNPFISAPPFTDHYLGNGP